MLTLAEVESTLQIKYELLLEALSEDALRALLADRAALGKLIPGHLSDAEGRTIAEATLAAMLAPKAGEAAPPAPSAPSGSASAWGGLFSLFCFPFRRP